MAGLRSAAGRVTKASIGKCHLLILMINLLPTQRATPLYDLNDQPASYATSNPTITKFTQATNRNWHQCNSCKRRDTTFPELNITALYTPVINERSYLVTLCNSSFYGFSIADSMYYHVTMSMHIEDLCLCFW